MLPPGEGPPGHPPPGYQMMYLMPDGRVMPAHPMAPPRAMMGGPGPHPPPSYLPGPPWGVPAPNWGGAPLPNWGGATQVGGHPQASLGHRHQPPPPPPGAPTGGGPPPWHKATPPPPPHGAAVGFNHPNGMRNNSGAGGGYGTPRQGCVALNNGAKRGVKNSVDTGNRPALSAPAPPNAFASAKGVTAPGDSTSKSPKPNQQAMKKKKDKDTGVTFPTVDEIPVLTPVDVDSLPLEMKQYRAERAKHWPSRKADEARLNAHTAGADADAALFAEQALVKEKRKARLAEVLAQQRALGHFDASEEIGNLDGDRVGTSTGAEHGVGDGRLGKNGKGRGHGKGGRGRKGAASQPGPPQTANNARWSAGVKRPSPFEQGDAGHLAKHARVDLGLDIAGDRPWDGDDPRDGAQPPERNAHAKTATVRACRFWSEGSCRKGDTCGFSHDGETGTALAPPGAYALPGNGDAIDLVIGDGVPTGDGTGDGTGDEQPTQPPVGTSPVVGKKKAHCRYHQRGKCAAGDACAFSHADRKHSSMGKQSGNNNNNPGNTANRPATRGAQTHNQTPGGQTLLKKLFAKEVRSDKSRLLQVFRWLTRNDFLKTALLAKNVQASDQNLWMFPWVDDPPRENKAKAKPRSPPANAETEDGAEDE